MKIKRLEIIGFKSFVDRTVLDFDAGITGVVGPNGCGKSNIVDAVRWAMGEQSAKNLRGRGMEDVIFGGSEVRRAHGMAEVSLLFDNSDGLAPPTYRDYAEIMVTRRLYRSGDSEYLINKTPCRLLDITELFMDTGVGVRAYSIIEQGKIGQILSARSEDRRQLIEEAAGVTKFKSRKKSALRKIEATRQNLLRLSDILSEVRRQLGSLKRQAQKAERFRLLREELRQLEQSQARLQLAELETQGEAAVEAVNAQQQRLAGMESGEESGTLRLEELRLKQVGLEKDVSAGQEQIFHFTSEIQQAEGRIENGGRQIEGLVRQQEQLLEEQQQVRDRLKETEEEERSLNEGLQDFSAELVSGQRQLLEGEGALQEMLALEEDSTEALDQTRNDLFALLSALSRLVNEQEEARRLLQGTDERVERNCQEAIRLREERLQRQERLEDLAGELGRLQLQWESLNDERDELREELVTLRRRREENDTALQAARQSEGRSRSRLESLQELETRLEGYGGGVQALLKDEVLRAKLAKEMVADLFTCPSRYEVAVEAALGESLQALRVSDEDTARSALDLLQREKSRGRLYFPAPSALLPSLVGAEPLLSRISEEGMDHPLASLLGGFFLVPQLDPFFAQPLPPGVTLVTEMGELLTWRGELIGGSAAMTGGILHKKREIRELTTTVAQQQEEVECLVRLRQQVEEGQLAAEERLNDVAAMLHRYELQRVDLKKDRERHDDELRQLDERIELLSLETEQLHEDRGTLTLQLENASGSWREKEAQRGELEERQLHLQEALQVHHREAAAIRERVTTLKVTVASLQERQQGASQGLERLHRQREELKARLGQLQIRHEEAVAERERLHDEGGEWRSRLDVLFRHREEKQRDFILLKERFEEGNAAIAAQEEALREDRSRLNVAREDLNRLQLQLRELALRREHLCDNFFERYRLPLVEQPLPEGEVLAREEATRRIEKLTRQVDDLGEVNLTAIEEYRELDERHEFLVRQQEDLNLSLEGLNSAISRINRTTRKRFKETFDQVNSRFQEVFPRLFRGGQAELRLTDEEDLLETGVEIVVQPPGKKLQNVSLLSGGEKALTAVSLIFAIFLIKPSPFCMLDEVDAPLDEANIGRFSDMVVEMAQSSQFIIITHSKRTMEAADILYGVTMEEPGVSRLVSVRLHDFT